MPYNAHHRMQPIDLPHAQSRLLKTLRHTQGLTQKELSLRSGVALSTIKELETDIRIARLETLFKLVRGLDIDPSLLLLPLYDVWSGTQENILTALAQRQSR